MAPRSKPSVRPVRRKITVPMGDWRLRLPFYTFVFDLLRSADSPVWVAFIVVPALSSAIQVPRGVILLLTAAGTINSLKGRASSASNGEVVCYV